MTGRIIAVSLSESRPSFFRLENIVLGAGENPLGCQPKKLRHMAQSIAHRAWSKEPGARIQEKENQNWLHLSYLLFEPQNIESAAGGNIEVITSSFCGSLFCGSIFRALNHPPSLV
jgi:hypothetical protein